MRMHRIKAFLDRFQRDSRTYFAQCAPEIARTNLGLLRKTNWISMAMLGLYLVLTCWIFQNFVLAAIYCVYLAVNLLLMVVERRLARQQPLDSRRVNRLCLLFVSYVMSFILIISVFPFPDRPAIFYPVFSLLMCVLFIQPYARLMALLTAFEALFLALAFVCKSRGTMGYDVFGSATTWVLGLLVAYLVLDLRIREGLTRQRLLLVSTTDEVMGIPNRHAFNRHLEEAYARCKETGAPIGLLMLDIDDFKRYNDRYGHLAGDDCLRRLGALVERFARERALFAARFGGEELSVVLTGEQTSRALSYARALIEEIARCAIPTQDSPTGVVTVSIGAAVLASPADEDPVLLIQRADTALYQAKRAGKNRAALYGEAQ